MEGIIIAKFNEVKKNLQNLTDGYITHFMTPEQVIAHYGSQAAAGRALGLDRATICTWLARKRIPETRQAWIQLLTKGKLKVSNGK